MSTALWLAFWAINIGLALMVLISFLPIGLMQTWPWLSTGAWYVRSAEFGRPSCGGADCRGGCRRPYG